MVIKTFDSRREKERFYQESLFFFVFLKSEVLCFCGDTIYNSFQLPQFTREQFMINAYGFQDIGNKQNSLNIKEK